ncbi:MAG: hypothetical protein IGR93_07905 [Hydrococcus sp. C42_A2020_068]|uniref:hypothetical protein n=1 Tax=Pleurocapsa sp. PCC 7327 TaxID=118163 RepID=UPI000304D47F|nr:hypothetical protein [Pleurocapsa sp. PCC 7327]MBF2020014.1 hypothetical protein [Hydrococcus sp. C42_A2020_068]
MNWGLLPQVSLKAQTGIERGATGSDRPSQVPPQPASQQLDYRTPQQIFLRRTNNATIMCAETSSAQCDRVIPQVESLENNETLNRLRESRQEAVGSDRQPNNK